MDLGLGGVSVLVGGASSGIGFACARAFLQEGAQVTVVARGGDKLRQAWETLEGEAPQRVWAVAQDLAEPGGAARAYQEASAHFGPPLVVVANGGGPPAMPAVAATPESFAQAHQLLLRPVVELVQAALPAMKAAGWGRVIAITSVAVRQPEQGLVLSSSLRAAVWGYLKTLAREEASSGVTFNALCPGYTATERLNALAKTLASREGVPEEEIVRRWLSKTPVGRLGKPEELAAAAVFLASRQAGFINGVALAVDGGACLGFL
ncbi:MAG: SDR family oxidoreductase [Thermoanaerobaculum sp.]|nr:SDR family oxidoreductase [Thermoanaerobaculum sp.]